MKVLKRVLSMLLVATVVLSQVDLVYAESETPVGVNDGTVGSGKYWVSEDDTYIVPKEEEAAINFVLDGFDEIEELKDGFLIELFHTELPVVVRIPVVELNDFSAYANYLPAGVYKWSGVKDVSDIHKYYDVDVITEEEFVLKPGVTSEFTVFTKQKYEEELSYDDETDAATVLDEKEDDKEETKEEKKKEVKEEQKKEKSKIMFLLLYLPLGVVVAGFAYLIWRRNQW